MNIQERYNKWTEQDLRAKLLRYEHDLADRSVAKALKDYAVVQISAIKSELDRRANISSMIN